MFNRLCNGVLQPIKRRNANWIGHNLRRNFFLKHVVKGKIDGTIEVTGRRGRGSKQLLGDYGKERILEIERGNASSHLMGNSLWERETVECVCVMEGIFTVMPWSCALPAAQSPGGRGGGAFAFR